MSRLKVIGIIVVLSFIGMYIGSMLGTMMGNHLYPRETICIKEK